MSAFLSTNDALSALATAWKILYSDEEPYLSLARVLFKVYEMNDWTEACDIAKDRISLSSKGDVASVVFRYLLDENLESLRFRYPNVEEFAEEALAYTYKYQPLVREWLMNNQVWQLNTMVRSYEYQSCEHNGWRFSIAYALILDIKDRLLNHVSNSQQPDRADVSYWSWEAPIPSDSSNTSALSARR